MSVDPVLNIRLRAVDPPTAEAVCAGVRPNSSVSLALRWHAEYPLDGDIRACGGFADRFAAGEHVEPFGYYFVTVEDGTGETVVGGAGFHGPPILGTVEVGYSIVPDWRGRGVATAALKLLLDKLSQSEVELVLGTAENGNSASQSVMLSAGMQRVGVDEHLHYFDWAPPAVRAGKVCDSK